MQATYSFIFALIFFVLQSIARNTNSSKQIINVSSSTLEIYPERTQAIHQLNGRVA
jgi:hypothetical protein